MDRYASLYFITAVDAEDNELLALQTIHFYVEVLDKYFGNVCELDLVFNFHKAFYTLDEVRALRDDDDIVHVDGEEAGGKRRIDTAALGRSLGRSCGSAALRSVSINVS